MLSRASGRCLLHLGRRYVFAASFSTQAGQKVITIDNMNPQVKKMEYAVRGPLVIRATAIEKELEAVSVCLVILARLCVTAVRRQHSTGCLACLQ